MNIEEFWEAVLKQDEKKIKIYFNDDAIINWHCTNEQFTVNEFIRANCDYPGEWDGKIERKIIIDDLIITVTHVYAKDKSLSFHVTSFVKVKDDRIISIDEYWGDDGVAPKWRLEKHIGKAIK